MVEAELVHTQDRVDGAALEVGGAVDERRHAGVHDRAHAHEAGLERHVERAAGETVVRKRGRPGAKCHDLRMGGGIPGGDRLVEAGGDDLSLHDQDRADRNLSLLPGPPRLVESEPHEGLVVARAPAPYFRHSRSRSFRSRPRFASSVRVTPPLNWPMIFSVLRLSSQATSTRISCHPGATSSTAVKFPLRIRKTSAFFSMVLPSFSSMTGASSTQTLSEPVFNGCSKSIRRRPIAGPMRGVTGAM